VSSAKRTLVYHVAVGVLCDASGSDAAWLFGSRVLSRQGYTETDPAGHSATEVLNRVLNVNTLLARA
jgi:hypothetical protein